MEIRHLQYFKAIAESENMSQAARQLHITQPYLSCMVKMLEEEFGLPLFERAGRRLILNPNGMVLLSYANKVLNLTEHVYTDLQDMKQNAEKSIKITLLNSTKLFPELIYSFSKIHPEINFHIANFTSIQDAPKSSDIIIHASNTLANTMNTIPLFEEECVLGMSSNHALAKAETITAQLLEDQPFLMLTQENTLGDLIRQYFKPLGINPLVQLQCDNQQILAAFISQGAGLAFFPAKTWDLENTDIVFRKIENHTLKRTIYLSTKKKETSPIVDLFINYLQSEITRNNI